MKNGKNLAYFIPEFGTFSKPVWHIWHIKLGVLAFFADENLATLHRTSHLHSNGCGQIRRFYPSCRSAHQRLSGGHWAADVQRQHQNHRTPAEIVHTASRRSGRQITFGPWSVSSWAITCLSGAPSSGMTHERPAPTQNVFRAMELLRDQTEET